MFVWNNAFQRLINICVLMVLVVISILVSNLSELLWLRVTALSFLLFLVVEARERYYDYRRQKQRQRVLLPEVPRGPDLTETHTADLTAPIRQETI